MADSQSDNKREQVARVYEGMTDRELEDLAEDAWSLTDIGENALNGELAKRNLHVDLNELRPQHEQTSRLVVLRRFTDLSEAELAKSILESTGIKCSLRDHNTIGANWGWSNALGGVKLCVNTEDMDTAAQILGQEIPDKFDVEGIGQYTQPRCPNCQSLNIFLRDKPYSGFVIGVPGAIERSGHAWLCHTCNHEWPESDDAPEHDVQSES